MNVQESTVPTWKVRRNLRTTDHISPFLSFNSLVCRPVPTDVDQLLTADATSLPPPIPAGSELAGAMTSRQLRTCAARSGECQRHANVCMLKPYKQPATGILMSADKDLP